ncbi:hypothetical protein AB9P05_02225 [Roseivirga sp. BDSF3-8]|uniref:hypothetical protein n=1 Tax=Roseivirga sp. BDSF3-8 TaxID=3241598 RepID=UPI0035327091
MRYIRHIAGLTFALILLCSAGTLAQQAAMPDPVVYERSADRGAAGRLPVPQLQQGEFCMRFYSIYPMGAKTLVQIAFQDSVYQLSAYVYPWFKFPLQYNTDTLNGDIESLWYRLDSLNITTLPDESEVCLTITKDGVMGKIDHEEFSKVWSDAAYYKVEIVSPQTYRVYQYTAPELYQRSADKYKDQFTLRFPDHEHFARVIQEINKVVDLEQLIVYQQRKELHIRYIIKVMEFTNLNI